MDPVSIIVAALAAGAVAGVKETATAAVKEAYHALKHQLMQRYSGVNTSGVESKPDSKAQQDAVKESLGDVGAGKDTQLISTAKTLLEAIAAHDPGAAKTVGVVLSDVHGASIDIHDVETAQDATGLHATNVTAAGPINISGVRTGTQRPEHP